MRSLMSTLASTAIPIVSTIPASPGRVSVAPKDGEVLGFVDREVPFDDAAPAWNLRLDDRRRVDIVVEDDRHPPAHICGGQILEYARPVCVEGERHDPRPDALTFLYACIR